MELNVEARSLDPQLLRGHAITAKLYHDSPDLSDAQPVLESTLDLVGQGPDTSDRMAGSQVDWHTGAAKVAVLCCAVLCCAVLCCAVLYCAVLCCAVLCCAVLATLTLLCHAVLCHAGCDQMCCVVVWCAE